MSGFDDLKKKYSTQDAAASTPTTGGGFAALRTKYNAPGPSWIPEGVRSAVHSGVKNAGKVVGDAVKSKPFTATMDALGAPQRALESAEISANDPNHPGLGESIRRAGHEFMTPKDSKKLQKSTDSIMGLDAFDKAVHGTDLGSKGLRGIVHTAKDMFNDPLMLGGEAIEGLKAAGEAAKAAPAIGKALETFGKVAEKTGVPGKARELFSSEAGMEAMTPHGRAVGQAELNRMRAEKQRLSQEGGAIIAKHQADLRKGVIHPEVKALADKHNFDLRAQEDDVDPLDEGRTVSGPGKPIDPQQAKKELDRALDAKMHKDFIKNTMKRSATEDPDKVFKPGTSDIERAGARTKSMLQSQPPKRGEAENFLGKITRTGNKAFLANPVPHTGNLTDLSYNAYGAMPTLEGLKESTLIATGKTRKIEDILKADPATLTQSEKGLKELHDVGAHSQYGNVYNELGISRVGGLKGTEGAASVINKPLIGAQKVSNKLQNTLLNPLESGLRIAALRAEKRLHPNLSPEEWGRNIHRAFGTDEANKVTRMAQAVGAPFAKFHGQTAIGSGLRTLATNPARVVNVGKADRDMNAQVNPHGPDYTPGVPGMITLRFLSDPIGVATSLLGPLANIKASWSTLSKAQKGKIGEALQQLIGPDVGGKFIPLDDVIRTIDEALHKKKGIGGESPAQEIAPDIFGGYYTKRK